MAIIAEFPPVFMVYSFITFGIALKMHPEYLPGKHFLRQLHLSPYRLRYLFRNTNNRRGKRNEYTV